MKRLCAVLAVLLAAFIGWRIGVRTVKVEYGPAEVSWAIEGIQIRMSELEDDLARLTEMQMRMMEK